jgi:plasmid stabilization system protein ParE
MVKVKWTDYALENLISIGDFIELDSYYYAKRTVNYLFNAVDILEFHPFVGRVVPEFENKTIRELTVEEPAKKSGALMEHINKGGVRKESLISYAI